MNGRILRKILAQRIPPEQFEFQGDEIHFHDGFNTPENRAIVADVIANYDALAAAYELSQIPIKRQAMYQAEADPLFTAYQAMLAAEHPDAEAKRVEWLAKRVEIKARWHSTAR